LASALVLPGCSPVKDEATTQAAATTTAAATTAATTVTTTTTLPAGPTEEIDDIVVETEFIDMPEEGDGLPPVATVGGLAVSQSEYRYLLNTFKSIYLLNTGMDPDSDEVANFWTRTNSAGKTRLDEAREKVLAELHQIKICQLVAEDLGLALEQSDLENISTDLRAQESRFGGRPAFEKVLSDDYGIALADYWKVNESVALREKVLTAVRDSITVSESEATDYFNAHAELFGPMVRLRQIMFLTEGTDIKNERTEEETRALADETFTALKAGADMEGLARERSEDPAVSLNGGERAVTKDDPFAPEELLDWAFRAKTGDVAVIETSFGVYVARVEERIERSFDSVREAIELTLMDHKLAAQLAEWKKEPAYAMKLNMDVLNGIV